MSALTYLDTGRFDVREIRADNRAANLANALQLIDTEREYWKNYALRAKCHGDIEYAQDKLEECDRMERNARASLSAPTVSKELR